MARREPGRRVPALRLLGARGVTTHLADAIGFLHGERGRARDADSNLWRIGYLQYLAELPATVTLALGRAWFHEPWPVGVAGRAIVERHATADDGPMLEAAAAAALASGDMYVLCSCIDGLAAVGRRASVPLLVAIHDQVDYSYARRRARAALAPHATDAACAARLVEALWDCESGTRRLACAHAPASATEVGDRLGALADDPCEDDDVRAAARARLDRA